MNRHIWCTQCGRSYQNKEPKERWLCDQCRRKITISYLKAQASKGDNVLNAAIKKLESNTVEHKD